MSEIEEIESRLQFAIAKMNAAADAHKQTEIALREATLSVSGLRKALDEARRAEDRKLPQCKIVRYSVRQDYAVDACIVGLTKGGMLRVRQIGADGVELFKWSGSRHESRAGAWWKKDYLAKVPAEFAR